MKLLICIDVLRSANECAAVDDVRSYLNGIHIKGDRVESTNGQVLYMSKGSVPIDENWFVSDYHKEDFIIKINGKIPKSKKIRYSSIESDGESNFIIRYFSGLGCQVDIGCGSSISGRFPNLPKLTAKIRRKTPSTFCVGLNSKYLGLVDKIFSRNHQFPAVSVEFFEEMEGVIITNKNPHDKLMCGKETMVIMPIRL